MYNWMVGSAVKKEYIRRQIIMEYGGILYIRGRKDIAEKLSDIHELAYDDVYNAINIAVNTTTNNHFKNSRLMEYFDEYGLAFEIPKELTFREKKSLLKDAIDFFGYFVRYLENHLIYLAEEKNMESWLITQFRYNTETGHFEPVQ